MRSIQSAARRYAAVLGLAVAMCHPAAAGTVTLDFEDGPYGFPGVPLGPGSGTNNFQIDNFVFSPGCHFDWPESGPAKGGRWLGFDTSGCYDQEPGSSNIGYNKNYLGPGGPVVKTSTMFVQEVHGHAFSLESFVFSGLYQGPVGTVSVRSSKGGSLSTGVAYFETFTFSGPEWTDVLWLEFESQAPGVPVGFDDLVLSGSSIPEPGALSLALVACIGAGVASRQRRSSAS